MAYVDLGNRIRDARERMRLSQEELAELARLNRVTIAKYESGKVEPGAQALSRIADALEVTVDALMGRDEPEGTERQPKTLEAQIVSFGMDNLPKDEREKILSVLQAMYQNKPGLFAKGDENES